MVQTELVVADAVWLRSPSVELVAGLSLGVTEVPFVVCMVLSDDVVVLVVDVGVEVVLDAVVVLHSPTSRPTVDCLVRKKNGHNGLDVVVLAVLVEPVVLVVLVLVEAEEVVEEEADVELEVEVVLEVVLEAVEVAVEVGVEEAEVEEEEAEEEEEEAVVALEITRTSTSCDSFSLDS